MDFFKSAVIRPNRKLSAYELYVDCDLTRVEIGGNLIRI